MGVFVIVITWFLLFVTSSIAYAMAHRARAKTDVIWSFLQRREEAQRVAKGEDVKATSAAVFSDARSL